ncbi:MAG: hypothetical protein HZB55_02905 [Deltaproteobacteria bacterium]|nr:hypothetical protein [Deltaproteobacteria bacterium]
MGDEEEAVWISGVPRTTLGSVARELERQAANLELDLGIIDADTAEGATKILRRVASVFRAGEALGALWEFDAWTLNPALDSLVRRGAKEQRSH